MTDFLYKAKSVIIGHAVGDALGVPVEFSDREELEKSPVTDMEGYGTYQVPKGAWSDDTSMSLCALDCLDKDYIDWDGIMGNFARWLLSGEFTPTGVTFDAGRTCEKAVYNYCLNHKKALECGLSDEMSNGNGSLMRIHPFVLYGYKRQLCYSERVKLTENASALTHAHTRSRAGCLIYMLVLESLISNPNKDVITHALKEAQMHLQNYGEPKHYERIFGDGFKNIPCNKIKSTGYVVDTLEAAIWCLLNTSSYEECVLKAVNLGGDTDTVGAIAGGLAGALYGYDAIPKGWRNTLIKREYIEKLCEKAFG